MKCREEMKSMRLTLRALRASKNMSQTDAAKAIGVSPNTWYNYENHKSYPDALSIKKIEKAFNVTYDDIIFLPSNRDLITKGDDDHAAAN